MGLVFSDAGFLFSQSTNPDKKRLLRVAWCYHVLLVCVQVLDIKRNQKDSLTHAVGLPEFPAAAIFVEEFPVLHLFTPAAPACRKGCG